MTPSGVSADSRFFGPRRWWACSICVLVAIGVPVLGFFTEPPGLLVLTVPLAIVISGVIIAAYPGFELKAWERGVIFLRWMLLWFLIVILEIVALAMVSSCLYSLNWDGIV